VKRPEKIGYEDEKSLGIEKFEQAWHKQNNLVLSTEKELGKLKKWGGES
jgi:hypothetical protein